MQITSSYAVEIINNENTYKLFNPTIKIYNNAISFCIICFEKEWVEIEKLSGHKQFNYCENLIHSTSRNIAKYSDFDKHFYKFPSYIRRDVVSKALGHVKSYHSNLKNWQTNGCKDKEPKLQINVHEYPTFFRRDFYIGSENKDTVQIKLYLNNDWVWKKIRLKRTDLHYLEKYWNDAIKDELIYLNNSNKKGKDKDYKRPNTCNIKMSCPVLEKRHHKWFLRFAFEEEAELEKINKHSQIILAVDLGINTDAVCTVMKDDGTVLARKFIDFPSEKDQLKHTLNKIRKVSSKYCARKLYHKGKRNNNTTKLWRYARLKNNELARKIAKAITDYAVEQNVDVIVFEYLNTIGKKKFAKQKLTMWKKNTIQKLVEHKAHRKGIHISHICAKNTSKLAFDGSGLVLRGKDAGFDTYELCKFSTGKIYNCDLSASYNIGARYFIRNLPQILPARVWSVLQAKAPEVQKRTQCTYNTLINCLSILKQIEVA